jgi:hypothetical protein
VTPLPQPRYRNCSTRDRQVAGFLFQPGPRLSSVFDHQSSDSFHMPAILYTVRAACKDAQQRGRYLSWLSPNHVAAVMKGGATGVRIVLPDREGETAPAVVETHYEFPSRKAFDVYVRDHAPALRADGLKHFPLESGITYSRQVAEIAADL